MTYQRLNLFMIFRAGICVACTHILISGPSFIRLTFSENPGHANSVSHVWFTLWLIILFISSWSFMLLFVYTIKLFYAASWGIDFNPHHIRARFYSSGPEFSHPLKVSETNLRTKQTLVHYLGSQTKILIQSPCEC